MHTKLAKLYALLGKVVLLPIPLGKKAPIFSGWNQTTFTDTEHPEYQRKLYEAAQRGGNIGVLLGPASDKLMAIDIDRDDYAEQILELNPCLRQTTRTHGRNGCQLWIRIPANSDYPNTQAYYPLRTKDGQKFGEWRCGAQGGAQSIAYGRHPQGPDYEIIVPLSPVVLAFNEIKWPEWVVLPWIPLAQETNIKKAALPNLQSKQHAGDRRLREEEIVANVIEQCGDPAFFDEHRKMAAINERFWAKLAASESVLVHEPDEAQFYSYDASSGLYVATTNDVIRDRFADRIFRASQEWKDYSQLERFTGSRVLSGAIAHLRGVTESRAFNEPACTFIHCQNCILELTDNGYLNHPFSYRFKSRNRSPIAYEPLAKCPKFLSEVLAVLHEEDKELIQKVFGGMLLGYNIAQRILLLHGIGNTGKTTLALILQGVVGTQNISELRTSHLDNRFEIGRFLGKSLLVGVDVDSDFLSGSAISRLKGLVGGDFLDAERKSSNANFRLHGRFNILITSNSKLRIRLQGDQSAWRRRLLLVPYQQQRSSQTIRDFYQIILRDEAPGILLWGLDGLAKLRRDLQIYGDIHLSKRQLQLIENVLEESDSLRIFLRRSIARNDKDNLTVDEIVSAYLAFCINQQWSPMAPGIVQRHLEPLMLEYFGTGRDTHIERNGKAQRGFRNVRFRKNDNDDPNE
jgi:P4 family phage/plasmid primase-like protien